MYRKLIAIAVLGLLSTPVLAAQCATTIDASDAMQYDTSSISVPKTCKSFAVTLKHTGKLPKAAMGHNWVLARSADQAGVIADGMQAGVTGNYEKTGDTRIIAHTRLIGGGESDSTSFAVSALKPGETYVFFCTFPGHAALMHGTLSLAK